MDFLNTYGAFISLLLTYPIYRAINFLYQQIFITSSLRILKRDNPWNIIGYNQLSNEYYVAETSFFNIMVMAFKRFFANAIIFIIVLEILLSM